ncbi:complex I NDUFA9 subunit family protein [Humitalea sp. 24SJ18S-53]|uniref:complex I NDUFA9 subunit family protein n=1 Tax=Humitalea sp. 24SJ18S-53 TaxID=3422307 RepID=UPI003D66C506
MRRIAAVFGGSGFIGRQVVKRLAAQDYIVRIVTRDAEAVQPQMTQGRVGQIVPVLANISDDASVGRAVAGCDVVINLLGILFERRAGDFTRVQAEAPGRIARAASAAGVSHLVHISAIGADAGSDSLYARTKAEGEAAVRQGFPAAVILRPSVVFGPEDSFFNRFAGLARMLPFMPVVHGETKFQPVYVGDVADAVMAAIARPDAAGRVFELGGPRVASFRDLMGFVLTTTRRRKRMIDLPMGLVRFQARIGDRLPKPPLTTDQLKLLERDNVVAEGADGLAALGIAPTPMEAVVPGYLSRFRRGGDRRDTSPA